jgi:adenosylhomocysteine nucleosidase
MATAETWLVVAAERREFSGILKRFGKTGKLDWPAEFAREAMWNGDRWWLIANGPGRRLVERTLEKKTEVSGLISMGFCGALDPALRVGDRITNIDEIYSTDHVVVTAAEKRALRNKTGAAAVDMESAAVAAKASEWGVPFHCVRAVSDIASDDLPLDFNLYRDSEGRFGRTRIALAALARPFSAVPGLLRLDHNCRLAAEALGDFFANSRF